MDSREIGTSVDPCRGDHDLRGSLNSSPLTPGTPGLKVGLESEILTLRTTGMYRSDGVKLTRPMSRRAESPSVKPCFDNRITTAALRIDNAPPAWHYLNRKGGMEMTMSGPIVATRCNGRRPPAGALRNSIFPSGPSIAKVPAAFRQPLSNRSFGLRLDSVVVRPTEVSTCGIDGLGPLTNLIQKVLRFQLKARSSARRPVRINSGFLHRNSLAVKGDALIHGPHLVAQPVGSEWRIHRPVVSIHQLTKGVSQ